MILLINPNNRIVSPFAAIEPPLWAGLVASYYRSQGEKVKILDAEAFDLTPEETAVQALEYHPDSAMLVVMGNNPSVSSTPKMVVAAQLTEMLRYQIPLAITGLHPSALPEETEEELGIAVVKKPFEGLPDVAWDLLPMELYKAHVWHCLDGSIRSPYASVYTSMGCPMSCGFCNIHALYGGEHKIWYRSSADVVRELELLHKSYAVKNIKFWDELFTFNKKHVLNICDALIQRGLNLNIWAYARVDSVDKLTLSMMKSAGINWLAYGFEAGDDKVLSTNNKHASKEEAIEAVRLTHEAGINIIGNFIFNLPGDTPETMQVTLDFAKSLNIEFVNFYDFKPYPGSALYGKMADTISLEGGKRTGMNLWNGYNQYGQMSGFRDYAFNEYFTDIKYLNHIKERFGAQAVNQVLDMVKYGKPMTVGVENANTTVQK